jgi:hypothetical protein
MPASSATVAHWSLAERRATSPEGGRLDLDAPGRGIALADGRDCVLGVDLRSPCAAGEHWLRGGDLIAIYEPDDPRRLRATAMWRLSPAMAAAAGPAWELTLSAQTALVQSDAQLAVVCDVGCLDVRYRTAAGHWSGVAAGGQPPDDATCLLLRRPPAAAQRPETILVAVHPADTRRISLSWHDGRVQVACWLFSTAIEKGVLMRGRVLAALGPAARDEAWAGEVCDAFAAAPPPLTA